MTIPKKEKSEGQLCFVTIVFPYANDTELLAAKEKIDAAVSEMQRVKVEYRLTEVRDGGLE